MTMQGMVHVTARLSGPLADLVGHQVLEYSFPKQTQMAGIITMLYVQYPALAGKSASLRIELNGEVVNMHTELVEGDEVTISVKEDV